MDDADGVSVADSFRRFHHDASGFFRWQPLAAFEARRERFTIHVSHDEVDEPVGALADGVNRNDVRGWKAGGRSGFPPKPYADLLAKREVRSQHLDGDHTIAP